MFFFFSLLASGEFSYGVFFFSKSKIYMHHWMVTSVYFPRKFKWNPVCRFQVADVSCQSCLKQRKKNNTTFPFVRSLLLKSLYCCCVDLDVSVGLPSGGRGLKLNPKRRTSVTIAKRFKNNLKGSNFCPPGSVRFTVCSTACLLRTGGCGHG